MWNRSCVFCCDPTRALSSTEVSPPTVTQLTSLKQERREANRAHVFTCRRALGPAIVPLWLTGRWGNLLGWLCLLKEAMRGGLLQWCKKIPLRTLERWSLTCCFSLSVSLFLSSSTPKTHSWLSLLAPSSPEMSPSSPFSFSLFAVCLQKTKPHRLKGFRWRRWVTAVKPATFKKVKQWPPFNCCFCMDRSLDPKFMHNTKELWIPGLRGIATQTGIIPMPLLPLNGRH